MTNSGSGKTYLAAFDALNFHPKRLLYIVHEGSILKKSLETFQEVFGKSVTYGIYSGSSKESNADFVFASIQKGRYTLPERSCWVHTDADRMAIDRDLFL